MTDTLVRLAAEHGLTDQAGNSPAGLPERYLYSRDMAFRYAFGRWWGIDDLATTAIWHGAFIAGLLQEPPGLESLARAVKLATAIASLRCSVVGARSWLEQLPRT